MNDWDCKKCSVCGEVLPIDYFYQVRFHRNKTKSINPRCKACDNKKSREYYAKNRERLLAKKRGDYSEEPWRLRAAALNKHAGAVDQLTGLDLKKLWDESGGKCAYCGKKIKLAGAHFDHAEPLSKGGENIVTNIRVVCLSCNLRKGSSSERDYRILSTGAPF